MQVRPLHIFLRLGPVVGHCTVDDTSGIQILSHFLTVVVERHQHIVVDIDFLKVTVAEHRIILLLVYAIESFVGQKP